MSDTFKIIKIIQATDRKQLSHTLKDLLIAMLIRFGKRGYIDFDNSKIGEWINEEGGYVKNLLSKLKSKKYLKIEGRKSNRKIYLHPEFIRDCESRTKKVRDCESPVRDCESPSYNKNKENKENNNVVVSPETEKALKLIRPGETITSEIIATVEDGIKRLKYEIVADIILYVNANSNENYGGYLCKAIKNGWTTQKKSNQNFIKITDDMSKSEQQCCKCFNSNLKKPLDQRCFVVWGDTTPTKICTNNCPGVIQKKIVKEILK